MTGCLIIVRVVARTATGGPVPFCTAAGCRVSAFPSFIVCSAGFCCGVSLVSGTITLHHHWMHADLVVCKIAKLYRAEEGECDNNGCVKSIYASLSEERIVLLYLLNPFTIVSCAVQSTEILSQVGMLLSLLAALKVRSFSCVCS